MKRCKNGEIHFKNQAELNIEIKRRVKSILEDEIKKYKQAATREALILMLPIACTALNESHGFNKKRLEPFIEYFTTHLKCIEESVTDIDDYEKWCKDNKVKFFNVVEVENEKEKR